MNEATLNLSLPFDTFILEVITDKGRKIKECSDNYYVLKELYAGHTIDDYDNKPINSSKGITIHNIKSRTSDLRNKYGIPISSNFKEGKRYKEYYLAQRVLNG